MHEPKPTSAQTASAANHIPETLPSSPVEQNASAIPIIAAAHLLKAHEIVQMQRTIGNRAVINMLRPHPTPNLTIQRAAKIGVVQIEIDSATNLISNTHIATNDRPGGSIKGQEGSHTTAWVVTVEGIRQAIQGKTLVQAVAAIDTIYALAKSLPGAEDDRVNALSDERKAILTHTEAEADSAQTDATTTPSLHNLQRYIGWVVSYRNTLPLSAAKRGANANPNDEATNIAFLKNYTAYNAAQLTRAIFNLVDKKAIDSYQTAEDDEFEYDDGSGNDVNIDNPGSIKGEDGNDRVIAIIKQHLMWVKGLFPAAYAKAQISDDDVLDDILKNFGQREDFEDDVDVPDADNNPPVPTATTANDGFATEVVVDAGNVTGVWVTGRPDGVFGSQDKKHTTAWTVMVNGVENRLLNSTLDEAVGVMRTVITEAKALPGAKDAQKNALSNPAFTRYTSALTDMDNALLSSQQAITSNQTADIKHSRLQVLVHAYLSFRNAMALSAAIIPSQISTTGGKSEGRNIKIMNDYETAGVSRRLNTRKAAARNAMWGLLDFGAIKVAIDDKKARENDDIQKNARNVDYNTNMPGIDTAQTIYVRGANIIVQHLLSIKTAFPLGYSQLESAINQNLEDDLKDKTRLDGAPARMVAQVRADMRWRKPG